MRKFKLFSLLLFVGCIVSCSGASFGSNNGVHQNIPDDNVDHKIEKPVEDKHDDNVDHKVEKGEVEDIVEQDDVIKDNITLNNIDSIKSKDSNVVNIFEWVVKDTNDKDDSVKEVDSAIAGLK